MRKKYFTKEALKEAKSISAKKFREKNSERVKEGQKKWRTSNKETIDSYRISRRSTRAGYIDRFMERVKKRTPDTDITRAFLDEIVKETCCISGVPFDYQKTYNAYHNATAPSIDRIDSKRGYYKDNVQVMLSCLNRFKNDMPQEEFLKLWKVVTETNA